MTRNTAPQVVVIGGGPAGLMAADTLAAAGVGVALYDAMASCGRKFLLAGKGGLNLTHGEATATLLTRYGRARPALEAALAAMDGTALRAFAADLGIETFVGSSGRVFPSDLKAAPLLRAWLRHLRMAGVSFHPRHRWQGFTPDGALRFATPHGECELAAQATVLALGGGSWPALGSDGAWVRTLAALGVAVAPLVPANCGFTCTWSEHLRTRHAGAALKNLRLRHRDSAGTLHEAAGECVLTDYGLEGNALYALSGVLRETIAKAGTAVLEVDLAPERNLDALAAALARPRGRHTLAHHLAQHAGLRGAKVALLHEVLPRAAFDDARALAGHIKALPLTLTATRPLAEAISSAGGVRFEALDARCMLRALPGVFCAGEMLDWEAPTGGYLLTACFATGHAAARGVLDWLAQGRAR